MGTETCGMSAGSCAAKAEESERGETALAAAATNSGLAADCSESAAAARVESATFALLSRCLLRPARALSDDVASGSVASQLAEVFDGTCSSEIAQRLDSVRAFGEELSAREGDAARLALEVEYNRLFVGPGKLLAPPYESYYLSEARRAGSGRLRTDAERSVARAYAARGYAMPEEFVELPDHVAVELEFLALVAAQEAEAWDAGDAQRARDARHAADAFADAHPAQWLLAFARDVHAGARLPFYPAIADLACLLLCGECPE